MNEFNFSQQHKNFKAILCDVWGVLHNGIARHDLAIDALQQCKQKNKIVVLITNAPRPNKSVKQQLQMFNVGDDVYDEIITSGDVVKNLIKKYRKSIFHLGPKRDEKLFANIDINFENETQAKCVVCTGLFDDDIETPADYKTMFEKMIARNCTMLCANPDIVVERGEKIIYCAGALAALYEKMGGKVEVAGKPHAPIYQKAYEKINELAGEKINKHEILAIGDGMATDGKGAIDFQLPFLFITSGIHGKDCATENGRENFFTKNKINSQFWQTKLHWN